MFCPKCSQQQISDEVRFCSRCGFQLGIVKALLADNADAPGAPTMAMHTRAAVAPTTTDARDDRSRRKRDMTRGAALMFLFAFFVAVVSVELPPGHSGPIIGLIIVWLLVTLLINTGALLRYFFGRDTSSKTATSKTATSKTATSDASLVKRVRRLVSKVVKAARRQPALPPAHGMPTTSFAPQHARGNTSEVVAPPSVTEQTTNLLTKK